LRQALSSGRLRAARPEGDDVGAGLGRDEIVGYIRQVLPIVIQLTQDGGVRRWSEVYFSNYRGWR